MRRVAVILACAALATALPAPGAADPVAIASQVRQAGCGPWPAVARPFRTAASLDVAARKIADGASLETAMSNSGYDGRFFASVRLRTGNDNAALATLLRRHCDIVGDPKLVDAGVFRRGTETWLVFAAPMPRQAPVEPRAAGARLLDTINRARAEGRRCGREAFAATAPLTRSAALDEAAQRHAEDLARRGELSHDGFDGSTPGRRATRAGYAWAYVAENVARGQSTAEQVVETWLASPGHCANLMNPRATETGIGIAEDADGRWGAYWVQVYALPK